MINKASDPNLLSVCFAIAVFDSVPIGKRGISSRLLRVRGFVYRLEYMVLFYYFSDF